MHTHAVVGLWRKFFAILSVVGLWIAVHGGISYLYSLKPGEKDWTVLLVLLVFPVVQVLLILFAGDTLYHNVRIAISSLMLGGLILMFLLLWNSNGGVFLPKVPFSLIQIAMVFMYACGPTGLLMGKFAKHTTEYPLTEKESRHVSDDTASFKG